VRFDGTFTTLAHEHAGALLVTGDGLFTSRRDRLLALAARPAMPTIHSEKLLVQTGALMSYGTSITDAYRLAPRPEWGHHPVLRVAQHTTESKVRGT
jgi:putative ABC transport system substrate-binding protein